MSDEENPVTGAEQIAAERQRQIEAEGYSSEHDAEHADMELTRAALDYATHAVRQSSSEVYIGKDNWPWGISAWKPSDDPIRNLVKAGALIAAEIDRLSDV